jgi:hypothetical protein
MDRRLHYAEDMLWLWSFLHGLKVDGCLLEVHALNSIKGKVIILCCEAMANEHYMEQQDGCLKTIDSLVHNGEV